MVWGYIYFLFCQFVCPPSFYKCNFSEVVGPIAFIFGRIIGQDVKCVIDHISQPLLFYDFCWSFPAFTKKKNSENTWPNETNVSYYCHWICPFQKYTEGKKKRRVNILGDLILFIRMFFSILIYKDKNTNLINKFLKFH